ncbi:hypothetical protein OKW41_004195 [Paraburkholderia sp. UCT70]
MSRRAGRTLRGSGGGGRNNQRIEQSMRKLAVGIGMTMWLGCMAVTFAVAMASEEQVIVEGAQRAGETVRVSGQRVPLLHALEQIVPASYSVNVPNAGAGCSTAT